MSAQNSVLVHSIILDIFQSDPTDRLLRLKGVFMSNASNQSESEYRLNAVHPDDVQPC